MRNINFSADMVGIQTLAQQGIVAPQQDSVLSFGGGSFEDMILQMISNNLTLDENVVSDNSIAEDLIMQLPKEEDKDNKISDNIFYGLLNPEMIAQLAAIYNVQPSEYDDFVQQIIDTASSAPDMAVSASDMPIHIKDDIANAVKAETQVQTSAALKDIYNFRTEYNIVSENNNQLQNVQYKTQDLQNYNVPDGEYGELNENIAKTDFTKLNTAQSVTPEINIKDAAKTDFAISVSSKKDTQDNSDAMFADTQKMSFVSTADMLRMRNAGRTETANGTIMFKVADMPVNIDSPDAAEKLAEKIIMKVNENKFEVELFPKNLGKISVSLVLENGIVRVAMSGTNAKVNEFLASQSANVQSIVEKNTQYHAVVRVDDSQNQYNQQQRDNTQQSADDSQKQRQREHMQNLYQQNSVQHTEDFLSMLRLV